MTLRNILRYCQALLAIPAVLLPLSLVPASARGVDSSCISTDWPSSRSDLQADPNLVRGTLPNGMRYVLKENREPKNRVAAYLNVLAGSLHESDEQRGYAHFLEHMLFNGTTNFKPGELVEYFQSIGMSFGGDINARTSFDETVYHVILPDAGRAQLEKGFKVLADYARGALLLESEIERERGVILSEKRSRDSAEYRTYVAGSRFALRGTLMPERMPIGVDETLQKADRRLLKQYYDQWYRPDNMVLVVVGDFKAAEVEGLVKGAFAGLTAAGDAPECPDFGRLDHKGTEVFYHYEEELGKTEVSIESLWNTEPEDDSLARQREELLRYTAALMMQHRLQRLQEKSGTAFSNAFYTAGEMFGRIGYASISGQAGPGKWQEALRLLEHTLRQALLHGFNDKELERAKKQIEAKLEEDVLTAATRDSKEVANDIIRHFNDNKVFMSPEQQRDLYRPMLAEMTLAEINASLAATWAGDSRLIALTGNTRLEEAKASETIRTAYDQAAGEAVDAIAGLSGATFPYLPEPTAGRTEAVIPFAEIGAERLVFANGVTVNLKKTDFDKNEVLAEVHIGSGKLSEPRPGLALLASGVVNGSGSGALSRSDFDEVLAGSTVGAMFKVGESSFVWAGKSITSETERLFQVLHTLVVDPGFRPDIFERVKRDLQQAYQGMERNVEGVMQFKVQPFLAGGDPRFGMPPWSEVEKTTLEEVRNWLEPELREGRIEVTVVGDFDRQQVASLAARYFGGLAKRDKQPAKVEPVTFPAGQKLEAEVQSSIDKSLIVVAWPTDDFWDIHRTRRLHMLASVLDDRLRKVVREKLGATYSPDVFSSSSRVYPHYGMLTVQMDVEPGKEQAVVDEVLRIADDLRRQGVTAEELERAKAPMLTSLKDAVRTNGYWLSSVLTLSTVYPQQLSWPTTILSDFGAVTAQEVDALADRYLLGEKAARAFVVPAGRDGR